MTCLHLLALVRLHPASDSAADFGVALETRISPSLAAPGSTSKEGEPGPSPAQVLQQSEGSMPSRPGDWAFRAFLGTLCLEGLGQAYHVTGQL